jgi:hypothetical protein
MNVKAWAEASQIAFLELLYDEYGIVTGAGPLWQGTACVTIGLEPEPAKVAKVLQLERQLRMCAYSDDPLRLYQTAAGVAVELPLPREMRRPIRLEQLPTLQGLRVAIGADGRGKAYVMDLESRPHALVAGASGCGKSEALRTIVAGLAEQNDPGSMELVLVDLERDTWGYFERLAHLREPVITGHGAAVSMIEELARGLETRGRASTPLVVVIDEVRMLTRDARALDLLVDLSERSRKRNVRLVLATQTPKADVLPTELTGNIGNLLAGRVNKATTSEVILGRRGAELLPRRPMGDFIDAEGRRMQMALVMAEDLGRLPMKSAPPVAAERQSVDREEPNAPPEPRPTQACEPREMEPWMRDWIVLRSQVTEDNVSLPGIVRTRQALGVGEKAARRFLDQVYDELAASPASPLSPHLPPRRQAIQG